MKDYRPLYERRSFCTEGTVLSQRIMDDASEQADHLKIFSLMAQAPTSSKFNAIKARYEVLTHQQFSPDTYNYDIAWALMEGVLQAQSDKADDDVVSLITQICYDH